MCNPLWSKAFDPERKEAKEAEVTAAFLKETRAAFNIKVYPDYGEIDEEPKLKPKQPSSSALSDSEYMMKPVQEQLWLFHEGQSRH